MAKQEQSKPQTIKEREEALVAKEAELQAREESVGKSEEALTAKEAETVKTSAVAMSKKEAEEAADRARKAKVDADNKAKFASRKAKEAELAGTPLNAEEKAFIAKIAPQMNNGKNQPAPADIQRYARLLKRKEVK